MATTFDPNKITFYDIKDALESNISKEIPGFNDTKILSLLTDSIAAALDSANYNIERVQRQVFPSLANTSSSVYEHAKSFNYVPKRKIPASGKLKLTIPKNILNKMRQEAITQNILNQTLNIKISISPKSKMSYQGTDFVTAKTYDLVIQLKSDLQEDLVVEKFFKPNTDPRLSALDSTFDIINPAETGIEVFQLSLKAETVTFTLEEMNTDFVEKELSDSSVSDIFGENDYGLNNGIFDEDSTITYYEFFDNLTQKKFYPIRSNWFTTQDVTIQKQLKQNRSYMYTYVKKNGNVAFVFGNNNDNFSRVPVSEGTVYYGSTLGSSGNVMGIIGKNIEFNDSIDDKLIVRCTTDENSEFLAYDSIGSKTITLNSGTIAELKNNLQFQFITNIVGGEDVETMDSTRQNYSTYFKTNGYRLVTKDDYVSYLRSTSIAGYSFSDAKAWSEHDELKNVNNNSIALPEFYNIVLYSVVKNFYDDSKFFYYNSSITDIDANYLEGYTYFAEDSKNYALSALISLYMKGDQNFVTNVLPLKFETVNMLNNDLNSKGQMTIKHAYMSPLIYNFKIRIGLSTEAISKTSTIKTKINEVIKTYLKDNAGFNPILKAKEIEYLISQKVNGIKALNSLEFIPEIANEFNDVISLDQFFTPNTQALKDSLTLQGKNILNSLSSPALYDSFISGIITSILSKADASFIYENEKVIGITKDQTGAQNIILSNSKYLKNFSMRTVLDSTFDFLKSFNGYNQNAYDNTAALITLFRSIASMIYSNELIQYSLLDEHGDLSGYSMNFETVKISPDIEYI